MVAVAGLAALALSNCIVTEGPASIGTGSTDNPSNGVAVANGGTASGTCLLPLGAGCIVPGASASTTGNANTGGSYSALALTGTGSASGALINVTGGSLGGANSANGGLFSFAGLAGGGGASGSLGGITLLGPATGLFAFAGVGGSNGSAAISGIGQSSGGLFGLSGVGNTSGLLALTGLGSASGSVAGTGSGAATGGILGFAGLGPASGGSAGVSGTGNSSGGLLALTGLFGSASGNGVAVATTGNANAPYAVSGTGNSSGSTVAVSGTGTASAPTAVGRPIDFARGSTHQTTVHVPIVDVQLGTTMTAASSSVCNYWMDGGAAYDKESGQNSIYESADVTGYTDCDSSRIDDLETFVQISDRGDGAGDAYNSNPGHAQGSGSGPVYAPTAQDVPGYTFRGGPGLDSCHACPDNEITYHYHIHVHAVRTGNTGDYCVAMSVVFGSNDFQLYSEDCP